MPAIRKSLELYEMCRQCRGDIRLEAATIGKAFADLKASGIMGSREHLKSASAELSAGNFADSIRESVHAVESIVRVLEPSDDLGKALAKLEVKAKFTVL